MLVHRQPGRDGYADVHEARRGEVLVPVNVPEAPAIDIAALLG